MTAAPPSFAWNASIHSLWRRWKLKRRSIQTANLLWVQDEPANQGAWPHIALSTTQAIGGTAIDNRVLRRISRRASASPATGNHHLHEDEAKALLVEAFTR